MSSVWKLDKPKVYALWWTSLTMCCYRSLKGERGLKRTRHTAPHQIARHHSARSPNSPRKPPPLGVGRNRRVKRDDLMEISQKPLKISLKKRYNLSNERTVVGAKIGAKALVEKCGNAGMTCVERGAVMPLMFCLPKGDERSRPSLEPRVAQKRVGWDKPPSFRRGCMTSV